MGLDVPMYNPVAVQREKDVNGSISMFIVEMNVPVQKVDATKKLPHEVFDPVRSQTRYRTSL